MTPATINFRDSPNKAREIARHWDERYSQGTRHSLEQPRPFLVEQAHHLPQNGLALDAAMGLGGNASFLIQSGLRVIGVDIAFVAIQRAAKRLPGLMAVLADLRSFHFPPNTFDVILNFYYLERSLFAFYINSLRRGGVLIIETMTNEMRSVRPDIDPIYLLEEGELRQAFSEMEILHYQEGWQQLNTPHPRAVASLVARRI